MSGGADAEASGAPLAGGTGFTERCEPAVRAGAAGLQGRWARPAPSGDAGRLRPDLQQVARVAPARDGDQMDSLAVMGVGIAPVPHLGEGGLECSLGIIRTVRHPELENEHLRPERHHHVGAAMAGGRLTAHIDADGAEDHVQETGIPGLVAGEFARRMPLVGNAGQPGLECGGKADKVVASREDRRSRPCSATSVTVLPRYRSKPRFRLSLTS